MTYPVTLTIAGLFLASFCFMIPGIVRYLLLGGSAMLVMAALVWPDNVARLVGYLH